ncbi:Putative ribonuclease HII/HIII, ribonuclease H-like superfamily [Septoria linicola]|uniref:Ribonuclease n=1 Tax=Septoria linicola TaxID=215465 RepID=A0A9Q9AN64_9PEZI|nr:putative ribonuclease HII/HIII, ribonuclease H-like superfamily [Septoria linicola]USW50033.1 Putative ribonuclease HII/HIII, ribonuclease H-like superfamily [Septoria linicola]
MDDPMEDQPDTQDILQETPPEDVFIAPSIHHDLVLSGDSYTHHSAIPKTIKDDMTTECVLGVDEAGRGPVLGPMVYALYYLPTTMHRSLLADKYKFDDSKVLTPAFRSELMEKICTPETDLYEHGGWAVRSLSAKDISSAMMRPNGMYNLNNQAMDATIDLIQEVLDSGVNIREVYIDTIGKPEVYQKKLEKIFPALSITVAKKADSLYPCVSAASVCAKVTRDAALDVLYTAYAGDDDSGEIAWGSGYPSDARCANWLKYNMDPVFGWGNECRFSWGTAKDMLETKGAPCRIEWPEADEGTDNMKLTGFFMGADDDQEDELATWYGRRVTEEVF